jgi:hypothetical protein
VNQEELEKRTAERKASNKHTPLFNLKAYLIRTTGVDLTAIPGIEAYTRVALPRD